MEHDLSKRWEKELFGIRRSVRYHARRVKWYEGWHTFTLTIAVIFGSATIYAALDKTNPTLIAAIASIVTFFAAVDLVVGRTRMVRLHHDFVRSFTQLEKDMGQAEMNEPELVRFHNRRLDIESEEPPVLRVLDTLCHNELAIAQGYEKSELYDVGPIQRFLAHWMNWRENSIKRYGEMSPSPPSNSQEAKAG